MRMKKGYSVLIVDGDGPRTWGGSVTAWLQTAGNRVFQVADADEAVLILETHTVDAVICRYRDRCSDRRGLLARARSDYPSVLRLLLCERRDAPMAIAARDDGVVHGFLLESAPAPEAESALYALLTPIRPRRPGGVTLYEAGI